MKRALLVLIAVLVLTGLVQVARTGPWQRGRVGAQPTAATPTSTNTRSSNVLLDSTRTAPEIKQPQVVESDARPFTPSVYQTFAEWQAACMRLPANRALKGGWPAKKLLPLKTFSHFEEVIDGFFGWAKASPLAQADLWVGPSPSSMDFFNTDKIYLKREIPFQPYAQKLEVSANAQVLFHGDFHGDIRSLITWIEWLNQQGYLEGFRLIRPETYLVFLGDYIDRGGYGVEVLYTLLRLKLANPNHVFLLRGNHEDASLANDYGFLTEIRFKYDRHFNYPKVLRVFDFFPAVIYVGHGTDFIQCNHGGMEPGYYPGTLLEAEGPLRFQFLGLLTQNRFRNDRGFLSQLDGPSQRTAQSFFQDFVPASPVAPATLGFLWNDFSLVKGERQLEFDTGRAFIFGDRATRYMLERSGTDTKKIHALFRAHQHSSVPTPMMRRLKASGGIFRHWQEGDSASLLQANETELARRLENTEERALGNFAVWTFNVAPDSMYGEGNQFQFDAFGILKISPQYADWKLRVVALQR